MINYAHDLNLSLQFDERRFPTHVSLLETSGKTENAPFRFAQNHS
jgi:hypothetical protein